MRRSLEQLSNQIEWIDVDNLYEAINEIKQSLLEIVKQLDQALPKEVEPD